MGANSAVTDVGGSGGGGGTGVGLAPCCGADLERQRTEPSADACEGLPMLAPGGCAGECEKGR
eukprot:2543201-Prymnesium_polylepis.1